MSSSVATTNVSDSLKSNKDNSSVIMSIQNSDCDKDDAKTVDICITTSDSNTVVQQTHATPKVVPLVYIQTPSKLNLPYASGNKTDTNNVIVNTVAPFHITNKSQKLAIPASIVNNQGVIIGSSVKTQQIVIQKPVSKITGAYLTMLKPSLNKIQSTENIQLITSSAPQSQKYVFTSMPKVTSSRLAVTATTNSVVQPKSIAFMPLIPKSNGATKQKIFNLKITDGQMHNEERSNKTDSLICDEVIDLESTEKSADKSYELSIVEEPIINIPDDDRKEKKETPKFPKHGISILKKSFNFAEHRRTEKNSLIISPVPNPVTVVSDGNTKEMKSTDTNLDDEPVIVAETKAPQKTERRRKSNVSYRRDYEDVEITSETWKAKRPRRSSFDAAEVTFTKLSDSEGSGHEMKDTSEDMIEIEVIKQSADINMNSEDYDVSKVLKWEDGIGSLPGSDLKFQMNEFGLLEYITKDEYQNIVNKKIAKVKEKETKKDTSQEDVQCLNCGCYGILSDFVNTKFCSLDCQETVNKVRKETKLRRKKKKLYKEHSGSEEEITSNENSQDRFAYPWTCAKKGFSWSKYLDHIKAKSAPVKLFKDAFPYNRNGFRPGMKLEGIDPQHPSYFCVLTVSEVMGYRIRLHFDGYPENYDFWVNADSTDIFPVGWCEKYGHVLHPPPGYNVDDFNWTSYLKQTKATAAPKHLFVNRAGNPICPNGFRVGMKLEAVDKKNTSLVCVATISDMMDNRILVHFDSWDNIYDYWADPTSPYIHPVGWCDQFGHKLTPPNVSVQELKAAKPNCYYPNPELFTWDRYLKETKSTAAPVRAFKQRPACGFKRGMRIECVDKRVPQLVRVATIDDVRDHQVRISFDGWPDRYSYWVDDDSPDIHPVGWCQKTGHPIEPPLTPDDVYDFLQCVTVGCRGVGHIKGPKFLKHTNQKHCPYAEENIDLEKILPDRLLTPDQAPEAVVPVSRDPIEKPKPRLGRPPKYQRVEPPPPPLKEEEPAEEEVKEEPKEEVKSAKQIYSTHLKSDPLDIKSELLLQRNSYELSPGEKQSWMKHSKYLMRYIKTHVDPRDWVEEEVREFVESLPSCKDYGDVFKQHRIDGDSFLMLTQRDLVDILNMKLGPAIKVYNIIVLLRQKINRYFT